MNKPNPKLFLGCPAELRRYIDYLSASNALLRGDLLRLDGKIQDMAADYNLLVDKHAAEVSSLERNLKTNQAVMRAITGLERPEQDIIRGCAPSVRGYIAYLESEINKLKQVAAQPSKVVMFRGKALDPQRVVGFQIPPFTLLSLSVSPVKDNDKIIGSYLFVTFTKINVITKDSSQINIPIYEKINVGFISLNESGAAVGGRKSYFFLINFVRAQLDYCYKLCAELAEKAAAEFMTELTNEWNGLNSKGGDV